MKPSPRRFGSDGLRLFKPWQYIDIQIVTNVQNLLTRLVKYNSNGKKTWRIHNVLSTYTEIYIFVHDEYLYPMTSITISSLLLIA